MNFAAFQWFKASSAHSHCPGNGYTISINKWHKLRNQIWWVVSNHLRAGLNVMLQDASLVFVVKTVSNPTLVACDGISCELSLCLGTCGISPALLSFAGRSALLADSPGASLALLQRAGMP